MQRKHLCADGLFQLVGQKFNDIPDHRVATNIRYSMTDTLKSGLAIFSLKSPSLLNFRERIRIEENNIKALFQIRDIPSDTQLRDIIDPIDPSHFRPTFDALLRELQRGKDLSKFLFMGHYAVALDGTGYFSSSKIRCRCCLEKKSKSDNSEFEYHHQMLAACIVHPELKQVVPLFPEPIMNSDGYTKNDCERNASLRWAKNFRIHHPKMPTIILEDSLASNVPHIKTLTENNLRYITSVKSSDHKYLFEQFEINQKTGCSKQVVTVTEDGIKVKKTITKTYDFINDLELNRTCDLKVNFLIMREKIETHNPVKRGPFTEEKTFSWVTDLEITKDNVVSIAKLARRRWAIENETFQTLKTTTEYNIEHNYGHGKKYLAANLAMLCFMAFAIDQILEIACDVFKEVLAKKKGKVTTYVPLNKASIASGAFLP